MKVIIGLGNPGRKYDNTPHNIGFEVIDALAGIMACSLRRSLRFNAKIGNASRNGEKVLLVKPQTFMNNSGSAAGAIVRYHKADVTDVIAVSDDADLDFGTMKVKFGGGSGGHRGVESLIQHLGQKEFARVRIGVGKGHEGQELVGHVLQRFSDKEKKIAEKIAARGAQSVLCLLDAGIDEAMNKYNGRQDVEQI